MGRIKKYLEYLGKCRREIAQLSANSNCSQLYHWIDYFCAVVRHGALIRQYTIGNFWQLSNAERKRRLTYPRMCRYMKQLNSKEYLHFLDNKVEFNQFFNNFVKREWLNVIISSVPIIETFIKEQNIVIVKPVDGVEGQNVTKINCPKNENELKSLCENLNKENVIIEECIIPHPDMVFGNTSVNTIRTHTIMGKDKKAHVIKAILRAGVGDTVADNYALGGSIYEVDVTSGVVNSYGKSKVGGTHIFHPGTDIIMLGYQIPHWDKVIDISIRAAEHLSQVGIIGWDVAITQDGVQLIEGNHNPDYELFEFLGSTGYNQKIKQLIF